MKIENLTLTNFNQREFKIHTYVLDQNPELVEQNVLWQLWFRAAALNTCLKEKVSQLL